MIEEDLDRRPVIVAIAGSNGAGKSTFYAAFLKQTGLRFINADIIAAEYDIGPYVAASVADSLRREHIKRSESFIFETVLSDPQGAKVDFLNDAVQSGFAVIFCFIAIPGPETSEQRVSMRTAQGGHDVPNTKLYARYPRTLANLARAIKKLPIVHVYDNSDLSKPFRLAATFRSSELETDPALIPAWLKLHLKVW